jgi:hypothetical protein
MMRAFFITTCVLSLIYIVVAFGIASAVQSYEWSSYSSYDTYDSYNSYDPYAYSYDYDNEADEATQAGGVISVIFMLISAVVFMLALMKIKTKTMKVISIIGLSISGIFLLWGFLPMTSPGGVSFDEVGPAFALAGIVLLAFNVVGTIHAFKTST